jgi:hypothetical protein
LGLLSLGAAVTWLSVEMLRQGRLYHRLKPSARPRRWVLIWLLFALGACVAWLPFMIFFPDAWITHFLLKVVAIAFIVVTLVVRNLGIIVDWFYQHKGWPLR